MNTQINEDYVSFEVAKLLKEKGFNESIKTCYHKNKFWEYNCNKTYNGDIFKFEENEYAAPTHQMALKWLREVHKYLIVVGNKNGNYLYLIKDLKTNTDLGISNNEYIYYEDAVEAALKYCLTNLIK